ncbi:hypothetical protein KY289_027109 [Solanum tuberosum]|nr:hypothetical protein KY289_027109 [Solanum tuberosum]KAH0662000.1 hypothetical protein KY284_026931 [Solanum tuberosum]
MAGLDITKLEHVFREQNKVADKLAKEGAKTGDAGQPIFFDIAPAWVEDELQADGTGTIYNRVINAPFCNIQGRDVTQATNNGAPVNTGQT